MANDFSEDNNCNALWRFESGALTTDSIGTNTLTDYNTVGEDITDYKEGACAASLSRSNSEYFAIADADLDAGFPLKSGDTNKKISICFWFKAESFDSSHGMYLFSKGSTSGSRASLALTIAQGSDNAYITPWIGYSSGASWEVLTSYGTKLSTGVWYHIAFTYDDSDKSYRLRVWDASAMDYLDSDVTGTAENNINAEDCSVGICAKTSYVTSVSPGYIDGLIDEFVIFNDILTTSEIDEIRAGTFGAGGTSTTIDLTKLIYNAAQGDYL